MMRFDDLLFELEEEAHGFTSHGTLRRRIGSDNVCPMFLGIRQPGSRRAFVIQVPRDKAPLPEAIPVSRGFNFDVLIAGDEDRRDYLSIIITAAASDYHEIFATICRDVYDNLCDLNSTREVIAALLKRVRLWQMFFEKQSATGLSIEEQKGLYGELHFLKHFVMPYSSDGACLRYWTGADGRQHDFQFGTMAVEVKTSSAKQHQTLRIANEQQLDETQVNELYLFYLSVSLVENNPASLPALVDDIRNHLGQDTADLDLFESLLLERGYSDAHCATYERTGYAIRRSGFFAVRDDFPRILEADIRTGVGDVSYSISLDGCAEYAVQDDDLRTKLRGVI